jgi:Predicted AAA-ATPase/PD-(D/E)XK nuclease superfamily
MLRPLPLSFADFRTIREHNFKYVDKTQYIYNLAKQPRMYFLARPRRFGKSMTIATLHELYKGSKELFEGLWIADHWDFTHIRPVFRISMKSLNYTSQPLEQALENELLSIARDAGIVLVERNFKNRFKEILKTLAQSNKVVVLIDEYDAPIMHYLDVNPALAVENREILKEFYTVLKENDALIELVFITGVSKFTKVGIFSGLNNLNDISMHSDYATMLGYTQEELEYNFDDYLAYIATEMSLTRAELLAKMKHWYNGYQFSKNAKTVYNPVSTNSFFDAREFKNFWFETGTPTFLIQHLLAKGLYRFDLNAVEESQFSSFDIENINTYGLLFQAGYLTIDSCDEMGDYNLRYPNYEVERSMTNYLITAFGGLEPMTGGTWANQVERAFLKNDVPTVISILQTIFKTIPYHLYEKNPESFYHAAIHLIFKYMGVKVVSESATSDGRSDAIVTTDSHIYILEFKLDKTPEIAFQQILNKNYAQAHAHQNKIIIGIGINFSSETKNIEGYKMEEIGA